MLAIYYDPVFLEHDTGPGHPERPERLVAARQALEAAGLWEQVREPAPASGEAVLRAHSPDLVRMLAALNRQGGGIIDGDTVMSARSWEAALLAAGAAIEAALAVWRGEISSAYALVRPPGHHATRARSMGFCLLNNVAIAARALQAEGARRLAIVDLDVHHGNGTQDIFYQDGEVLYCSTHQFPLYPGTGRAHEVGEGAGRGTTVNVPLPPGCGDEEYRQAMEQVIVPALRRFRPQALLVSLGFDAHWADPLAQQRLSLAGYAVLLSLLLAEARSLCDGRVVVCQEGGYDLDALAGGVVMAVRLLRGEDPGSDSLGPPRSRYRLDVSDLLARVNNLVMAAWSEAQRGAGEARAP